MNAQDFCELVENINSSHAMGRVSLLPVGALPDQLDSAEKEMNVKLPRAIRNFYQRHNGWGEWSIYIHGENGSDIQWEIVPLMEIVRSWRFFCDLPNQKNIWKEKLFGRDDVEEQGSDDNSGDITFRPPATSCDGFSESTFGVKAEVWNARWIPFAQNGCGDQLFVDLAPEVGGQYGQIVDWWHEGSLTRLEANSFVDWLDKISEGLSDGSIEICHSRDR